MKFALVGPQGAGKTTLLNALKKEEALIPFVFCEEVTRWVKSLGFNINEAGDDTTQYLIMMRHIFNLTVHPNMITDRSVIDCYAYTLWHYKRGMISQKSFEELTRAFESTVFNYDIIFYLPPEFDIEDDGVRSVSVEFRDEIDGYFKELLTKYGKRTFDLTGELNERVDKFKKIVSALYELKFD